MKQAIISALVVSLCGVLGCFGDLIGMFIATIASATGCIIYAINNNHK